MKKQPITTDLFRFVSVRSPQLLTDEEKEKGFVYFPGDLAKDSHFLEGFKDLEDDKEVRRNYLKAKANNFNSAYTSLEFTKTLNKNFYIFSSWLMKNKNILVKEKTFEMMAGIEPLPNQKIVKLWDNLLYQTITGKSDSILNVVLQILVGDNFLRKNDINKEGGVIIDNADLRRLANAYVVIPKRLPNNAPGFTAVLEKPREKDLNLLRKELDVFEAKIAIEDYSKGIEELEGAKRKLDLENMNNFNDAYLSYLDEVEEAYKKATLVKDPETGEIIYEGLELPDFKFEPKNLYDEEYLNENFSSTSLNIIQNARKKGVNENNLKDYIEKAQTKNFQTVIENYGIQNKTLVYKGSIIQVQESMPIVMSFMANAFYSRNEKKGFYLNLLISYPDTEVDIEKNELRIRLENNSIIDEFKLNIVERTNQTILLSSFPQVLDDTNEKSQIIEVTGSVLLSNDDVLSIETGQVEIGGKAAFGVIGSKSFAEVFLPKLEHYGINKVGIVDFRRVEQEVCCYVPGEVSRIENILAREYRERSTRQLISTETTTEDTSETEIEKLSDTVSAERNELATEISSILNQDKNKEFGASAGVEGSMGGIRFYANGYLNGASSTSTSNSDSTSETYAQEVSKRALERVVQKVSERRTSRILREYEENNKHGFDNRRGNTHVTGIYRWVDKIYTNRLINYGKRLVYEFNVPEPSRFFKEAIVQLLEGAQQHSGNPNGLILPEKPVAPQEFNIQSGQNINTGNYQIFAAKYGAVVQPPAKETIRISKSYSGGEGRERGNGASRFNFNDLEIPEGYEVLKFYLTFDYKRANNGNLHARLTIFNQTFVIVHRTDYSGHGAKFSTQQVILKYPYTETTTGVSILGWDIGGFILNITLICERTQEAYQQWQLDTYEAIWNAYRDRVVEYENRVRAFNDFLYSTYTPPAPDDEETKMEFNPLLNRVLEKRELKRIAIDMMTRPFNILTSKNNYVGNSETVLNLNYQFEKHASYVKFFEQAFDWEVMAYTFYPYYYAAKTQWKDLFQQSNGTDSVFQAFLQSGMARMEVPVRPGFEDLVNYFMETGKIWMGNQLVVDRDDDLYLSIAEELQQRAEGVVEEEWETRVPTELTILQANAAPLDETGLPCCHNENPEDNLAYGKSVMKGKDDEVMP